MKSYTLVAAAAMLATSHAAAVTLETTKCLWTNVPIEQFDIELNTAVPVATSKLRLPYPLTCNTN